MLVNKDLAGKSVATIYGDIKFNSKGETKDLTEAQRKELGNIRGFDYVEPKKAEPKKEAPKKAPAKKTIKKTETKK